MTMDDLYLLTDEDLSQDWKGAEHSREGGTSIHDPMWQMVNFDAIRKVSDACTCWRIIRVGDDDHTMATIDQFLTALALYIHMRHQSC